MCTFHLELHHAKVIEQNNIERLTGKITGKNQCKSQKSAIHYSPKQKSNVLLQKTDAQRLLMIYFSCNNHNWLLLSISGNSSNIAARDFVLLGS